MKIGNNLEKLHVLKIKIQTQSQVLQTCSKFIKTRIHTYIKFIIRKKVTIFTILQDKTNKAQHKQNLAVGGLERKES